MRPSQKGGVDAGQFEEPSPDGDQLARAAEVEVEAVPGVVGGGGEAEAFVDAAVLDLDEVEGQDAVADVALAHGQAGAGVDLVVGEAGDHPSCRPAVQE